MSGVNTYKDGVVARLYKGLQGLVKARKITLRRGRGQARRPGHRRGRRRSATRAGTSCWPPARTRSRCPAWRSTAAGHHHRPRAQPGPRARVASSCSAAASSASSSPASWKSFGADVTDRRGAAAPRPARGRGISKLLERAVPQAQINFKPGTPLRPASSTTDGRREGHARGRRARSRPSCCSSPSAAARSPPDLGYEEARRHDGPRLRPGRRAPAHQRRQRLRRRRPRPRPPARARRLPQGIFVAEQIAGPEPAGRSTTTGIPRVTYCDPEVASVGLTEAQAKEKYGATRSRPSRTTSAATARARSSRPPAPSSSSARQGRPRGRRPHGRRPGRRADRRGPADLQLGGAARPRSRQLIHAHPTQNEALGEAHLALAGKPLHAHG